MASVLQQARRNVDELSLLLEISELLDRSTDIRDELGPVLRLLARRTGMLRGTIWLLYTSPNPRDQRGFRMPASAGK
ncbi:MAG: hypothetical protein KBH78_12785, partial [Candidatus Hydrogenedentes bacterium]|nr:hypothetical protein [Candidatus Hydrogenedentota bacterium]